MPGGSGVASSGFDGVVRAARATAFIPAGTSVWELSVGGNDAKANDDYGKRTSGPGGAPTSDVVYIEAILAPWMKARTWAASKSTDGRWKDVLGYNLDRIDAWLESAPATTAWLAGQLGKALVGVRSLSEWWSATWVPSTRVPLDRTLVLAGREDAAHKFLEELVGGRQVIGLGGDLRIDEAMAFVSAALLEPDSAIASQVLARSLFVSDPISLAQLIAQPAPLVLLLAEPGLARDLPAVHPHQLVVLARPGAQDAIEVGRVDSQFAERALASSGLSNEESGQLGFLARQSLLALRRRLAVNPDLLVPDWAEYPSFSVRRLSLAGAWRSDSEGDKDVLAELSSQNFAAVIADAASLRTSSDGPLLDVVGEEWYVVAREDSWGLVWPAFDNADFEVFEDLAIRVFSESDPVLELDSDVRWRAGLLGVRKRYSSALRRGIAESLALMGSTGQSAFGTSRKPSDIARLVVRRVFAAANADSTYKLWTSLADVVGLLAEAAPEEFLSAMRQGLSGTDPLQAHMFQDSPKGKSPFGSTSPHPYFLWALESLGWSPDHIDAVVGVLLALASLDPGGELSNRPIESIDGLLSVWAPQTAASLDDRLRCMQLIANRSDRGFEILLGLVPQGHVTQMSHPGPRFRGWKSVPVTTRGDVISAVGAIADHLSTEFEVGPDRAVALIDRLDDFPEESRETFCDLIIAESSEWPEADKARVYEAIRSQIARHREYSDATWALQDAELAKLESVRDVLTPTDPVLRHRWLFSRDWIDLGDIRRQDDFAAYEQDMNQRRQLAVSEIFESGGLEKVLALADASDAYIVGFALGSDLSVDSEVVPLIGDDDRSRTALAAGYFTARLRRADMVFDEVLAIAEDPASKAFLLRYQPDFSRAMTTLEGLDDETRVAYWKGFNYYGLGTDFENSLEVAWRLLDADRPVAAIQARLLYSHGSEPDIETADLFATALETLLRMPEADPEIGGLQHYELQQVFAVLAQHREELGNARVVALEWHLMPIGLDGQAPSLHAAIAADPAFFVELIVTSYRSESERDERDEEGQGAPSDSPETTSESRRTAAGRAWEVLRSCNVVPGIDATGNLNSAVLDQWVTDARALLATADRREVGDLQIGELLSRAPRNDDGSPLPPAIRRLIEQLDSDAMVRGISIGISNSRGITSRNPTDGGQQETTLASQFRGWAEGAREWPHTRQVFQDLAESLERQAREQEASAERFRQGLH